jgi:hypothetical protein
VASFVAIGSQTATGGTTIVITTTEAVPAGSVIVIATGVNVGTVSGIADGTNTYTSRVSRTSLVNHYIFSTGILTATLASGSSITVTATSIGNEGWASAAYSRVILSATPDEIADSATLSTTTGALDQPVEIVFGSTVAYTAPGAITQSTGFTALNTDAVNFGADSFSFNFAAKMVAATTGVNYAVTTGGTLFSQVMVAFKAGLATPPFRRPTRFFKRSF